MAKEKKQLVTVDGVDVRGNGVPEEIGQHPNLNPGIETPEDLVHDAQGNVREVFSNEGVGVVTQSDAERVLQRIADEGKYRVVERKANDETGDETVYDVYNGKTLILVGAPLEVIESYYIKP